jgi:hypothetical protein
METSLNLRLLYTYDLQGDIELSPRLYSFIRALKNDSPPNIKTLLLDLGNSCDPDVWHCERTGGRSMLLAMDAMGYDAANVVGSLSPAVYVKATEQVSVTFIDADHSHNVENIAISALPINAHRDNGVNIILAPSGETRFEDNRVFFAPVEKGQIGDAQLINHAFEWTVHAMPANMPPDPTIAGAVEFILGEARYYAGRINGATSEDTR